jgi:outer membrane lipoprotein-sorting protein
MRRRTLFQLAVAMLTLPATVRAAVAPMDPGDAADIARVEAYLNTLHTLKARFIQVAPDGSVSQGVAWLDRPGRMRFQYDPPSPLLLVAGNGLFIFHDSELHQTTNLPLDATPLGLLLQDHLRLSGDVTVTRVARLPGQLQVTLVRTHAPQDGSLTLVFTDPPLALRQWSVVNAQHQETRVTLYNVETGGTFDQSLFVFVPRSSGSNSGGGG